MLLSKSASSNTFDGADNSSLLSNRLADCGNLDFKLLLLATEPVLLGFINVDSFGYKLRPIRENKEPLSPLITKLSLGYCF